MLKPLTTVKKTLHWASPRIIEKTAANHPVLECLLTIMFFLMLILTAVAFYFLSPLIVMP